MAREFIRFPISEAAKNMTMCVEVRVTGARLFAFRLWFGTLFIKIAARIIGCGIEITEK